MVALFAFFGVVWALGEECTFTTTDGHSYDLSSLKNGGAGFSFTDGTYNFQLAVCEPLMEGPCLQHYKSAICQGWTADTATVAEMGSTWSEHPEGSDKGVVATMVHGDSGCGTRRSATLTFTCDPEKFGDVEWTFLGAASTDCIYHFELRHYVACPSGTPTGHTSTTSTSTTTGTTTGTSTTGPARTCVWTSPEGDSYDFGPLMNGGRGYSFAEGPYSYDVTICEAIGDGVCAVFTDATVCQSWDHGRYQKLLARHPLAPTFAALPLSALGALMPLDPGTFDASCGEDVQGELHLICDPTVHGEPEFDVHYVETGCLYQIHCRHYYACPEGTPSQTTGTTTSTSTTTTTTGPPAYPCSYGVGEYHYELAPLINNGDGYTMVNGEYSYQVELCRPLLSGPCTTNSGVAACEMWDGGRSHKYLARRDTTSFKPFPTGDADGVVVHMAGGDACGDDVTSVDIELKCSPTTGGPLGLTFDRVEGCTYIFKAEHHYACPVGTPSTSTTTSTSGPATSSTSASSATSPVTSTTSGGTSTSTTAPTTSTSTTGSTTGPSTSTSTGSTTSTTGPTTSTSTTGPATSTSGTSSTTATGNTGGTTSGSAVPGEPTKRGFSTGDAIVVALCVLAVGLIPTVYAIIRWRRQRAIHNSPLYQPIKSINEPTG